MTHSIRVWTPTLVATVLGAVSSGTMGWAQAAAPESDSAAPPAAHWVQRKLDYTYQGFTTHYTCDGLRDTVRDMLVALGARKRDLQIQETGCTRFNGVEPFPGVKANFWVLEPVTANEAGQGGDGKAQATQWKTVDLVRLRALVPDQGQCELLEQLKKDALPLFTSRNLNFHSTCVPHQITLGDIQFTVDVLRPVPSAAPPA
ncbi:MAG TPA: hypothetical protein VGV09_19345 [Steroidobacteraceae bacterium]|nr:hypothetical protein [Steroidobacteraceae bacterium]